MRFDEALVTSAFYVRECDLKRRATSENGNWTKKHYPLSEFATYRQFPARVPTGVFENLDRYGLGPTRDRSSDA
jgi:hypothetical protein